MSEVYPKHHCGVFGVFGHPDAAKLTYYGLLALQHRGQESAGIATFDGDMHVHRGMGLVTEIFDQPTLDNLTGSLAIGHTRYSTTGSSNLKNAQPLVAQTARGHIAVAHNGNLINAPQLRAELEARGAIFQTSVDSEIVLHLLAQPSEKDAAAALAERLARLEGAYSLTMLCENRLIGARDPFGFRPLCLGKLGDAWILASENCALSLIHAEFVREIEAGEVIFIGPDGVKSQKIPQKIASKPHRNAFCVFEFVYFARPDSHFFGKNVAQVRIHLGRELAREHPADADIVVPVPGCGNWVALGFSEETDIPLEPAFLTNRYVGRAFLKPSQPARDTAVRVKLNVVAEIVRGKRVVLADDSIVRGTTSRVCVEALREAGAREVHVRVGCPPHLWPCAYGIDFPTRKELVAANNSPEEIRKFLGADSLGYLSLDGMIRATGLPANGFCTACYTADYPAPIHAELDKFSMEK
jgi:amidophosphoribosyltransferase